MTQKTRNHILFIFLTLSVCVCACIFVCNLPYLKTNDLSFFKYSFDEKVLVVVNRPHSYKILPDEQRTHFNEKQSFIHRSIYRFIWECCWKWCFQLKIQYHIISFLKCNNNSTFENIHHSNRAMFLSWCNMRVQTLIQRQYS